MFVFVQVVTCLASLFHFEVKENAVKLPVRVNNPVETSKLYPWVFMNVTALPVSEYERVVAVKV